MDSLKKISALVVVADSAKARFLYFQKENNRLVEKTALANHSARLMQRELTSDAPGRSLNQESGSRHSMSGADAKDHSLQMFAKDVATEINTISHRDATYRIVVVAAPRFLGQIRKHLSSKSIELLSGEVNKELTHLSEDDILVEVAELVTGGRPR